MADDILKRSRRVSLTVQEILFLQGALSIGIQANQSEKLHEKLSRIMREECDPERHRLVEAYRNAVEAKDGEIEVDADAEVSLSDDDGAYVQVWMWVSNSQAGLITEITCMSCGDTTNSDDSPDGERCPDCYNREVDHP
jgi:hypothetical protein